MTLNEFVTAIREIKPSETDTEFARYVQLTREQIASIYQVPIRMVPDAAVALVLNEDQKEKH